MSRPLRVFNQGSRSFALALASLAFAFATLPAAAAGNQPSLVMVFVIDGLRPDLITPENTPTLDRLRREGAEFLNAHSAFPTVTRVNAAVLVTGAHPQSTGITSNTLYERRLNGGQPFSTGDAANLWPWAELRGRMVLAPTLGERLAAAGISFAVVSSGSTGQAILLNSEVKRGTGLVINGGFEDGKRTAYPDSEDAIVREKFGRKPAKADSLEWAERVLHEHVLSELKPRVVIDWLTEPDHTQHQAGVGSPATLASIRRSDTAIGRTLELLGRDGRLAGTAVIVTADHGFAAHEEGVNIASELVGAGLKQSAVSRDVIITSDSHSVQFFVEGRDPRKIREIVAFLQRQAWADVVFVDAQEPGPATAPAVREVDAQPPVNGWLPGTFSLQLVHLAPVEGRPDIVLTLPWNSGRNTFGYPGRQTVNAGKRGKITSTASGHGGLSPWVVRTPLLLWGAAFKPGVKLSAPAGNVDVTPTVLALLGLEPSPASDGRPLREAFAEGPDEQAVPAETRLFEVKNGEGYHAALQISSVGRTRYIDKAWRVRGER